MQNLIPAKGTTCLFWQLWLYPNLNKFGENKKQHKDIIVHACISCANANQAIYISRANRKVAETTNFLKKDFFLINLFKFTRCTSCYWIKVKHKIFYQLSCKMKQDLNWKPHQLSEKQLLKNACKRLEARFSIKPRNSGKL